MKLPTHLNLAPRYKKKWSIRPLKHVPSWPGGVGVLWPCVKAAAEQRQVQVHGLPENAAGVSSAIHDGLVLK